MATPNWLRFGVLGILFPLALLVVVFGLFAITDSVLKYSVEGVDGEVTFSSDPTLFITVFFNNAFHSLILIVFAGFFFGVSLGAVLDFLLAGVNK